MRKANRILAEGWIQRLAAALTAILLLAACSEHRDARPNLILVIVDDVGIDQLAAFGFGGLDPPATPTIDALAHSGVRFANTWSMPTCSTTRAALFSGRYPVRTHVNTAIVSTDFANSQLSPFEKSLPDLLSGQGYVSAYVGKIHVTGSEVNPANHPLGDEVMKKLGWNYFAGYLDGGPRSIDVTAGLDNRDAAAAPFSCGYVPLPADHPDGASQGACYVAGGSCEELISVGNSVPGKMCLEGGGILDPNQHCGETAPGYLNFQRQNAYYTAELLINDETGSQRLGVDDPATRVYRTTLETDLAIAWVADRPAAQPWMLTVGYSAAHAPLQPAPARLARVAGALDGGIACDNTLDTRKVMNQTLEALDTELRRLLLAAGVYRKNSDGSLEYNPGSNTVVVFVGDNGTYGPVVKPPFLPTRAKGSVYQGGIWVPLIVTGPKVVEPGREVGALVNTTDLYHLLASLGGVDMTDPVINVRLDARALSPYLEDAHASFVRSTNFSMSGRNLSNGIPAPCALVDLNICVQLFPQKSVCASEGGTWYGEDGAVPGRSFPSCCAVNDYRVSQGDAPFDILAETQRTVRDAHYKLVQLEEPNCATGGITQRNEFYEIDEESHPPKLDDFAARDLLTQPSLSAVQQESYDAMSAELAAVVASEPECRGDGNLDRVVNQKDLDDWQLYSQLNGGRSSWYDINLDGLTNVTDRTIIAANLGLRCP